MLTPPTMNNCKLYHFTADFVVEEEAEGLGVEIYPGFVAARFCMTTLGRVIGGATGDIIGKDGKPTENYMRGMELHAKQTIFADTGDTLQKPCLKDLICVKAKILKPCNGIKELWDIDPEKVTGLTWHSAGWPLPAMFMALSFII